MIFVLFLLVLLIFPKNTFAVYEEYFFYKNCQRKELLQIGKAITQKFTIDKDFGAIEVYFEREGVGKGSLEFSLKKSSGEIVYKNIYPLEKVIHGYFFPFGFERVRVENPQEFSFSLRLVDNPSKAKIYVCRDNLGKLSFKVSGERSVFESLRFWFIYNIEQDLWFFGFYFALLILLAMLYRKI